MCVEWENLNNKSALIEVRHNALVEKLGGKYAAFFRSKKKSMRRHQKQGENRRWMCVRCKNRFFEEWKLDSESEDEIDLLCRMFDGWILFELQLLLEKKQFKSLRNIKKVKETQKVN